MGVAPTLIYVTKTIWSNFCSPILRSLYNKFELK